jgi:hypothetical protein
MRGVDKKGGREIGKKRWVWGEEGRMSPFNQGAFRVSIPRVSSWISFSRLCTDLRQGYWAKDRMEQCNVKIEF